MQPYQNYYPMNNNFMPNPYMDRMAQLQQYQQSLQQPMQNMLSNQMPGTTQQYGPIGKIVESVDVLKTTEVPMDGNIYYFPKADGSEIYSKQWLPNGTTCILTFKPISNEDTENVTNESEKLKIGLSDEVTDTFMKRFDSIEKRLDEFISKSTIKLTSRTKKDGDLDV